jgi:hypothetical protein
MFTRNSFGIEHPDGAVTFCEAQNFRIDRDGRLVFYNWFGLVRVATYNAGQWVRVLRGLAPEDLGEGRNE